MKRRSKGRGVKERSLFELLSDLIHVWHTERDWIDEKGEPRRISPRRFAQLCRTAQIERPQPRELLRLGLEVGALKFDRERRLRPADRTVIIRRGSKLLAERSLALRSNFESTVRHNTNPKTRDTDRRLDREVWGPAIPKSRERAYYRFVKKLVVPAIHRVSEWLVENRADDEEPHVIHVGMHAFAFKEEGADLTTPSRENLKRRRVVRGHRG
jgi:hypothetical protein